MSFQQLLKIWEVVLQAGTFRKKKKKEEEGIRHELTPGRRDWDCGVRAGMFLFSHFYFLRKVESKVITSEKRDEQAMLEV